MGGSFIEFKITYEHRLCRRGKQHGPLVYTVTLLPGEKITLYHSERFRRITSEQDRFSVATTFMQFASTIHQARVTNSMEALSDRLASVKTGSSVSAGGGLPSAILGTPSGSVSTSASVTDHTQLSVSHASDQFNQSVTQASMLTHAERSVVVSTYEDKETADITARSIQNDNACRAVTYFVRQVVELYSVTTAVYDIDYRLVAADAPGDWHTLDDVDWHTEAVRNAFKEAVVLLPKVGDEAERPRAVSVPTDGTVYDPELAKCCSCEPERAHRASLEDQLLELEVERRRLLLAKGDLTPFMPAPTAEAAVAGTP
ncbi:MAG: hypothetical protein H0V73_10705 [Chloroflexi bacterium]|nr:hypothetical protein [Chloroflexota bacterium]